MNCDGAQRAMDQLLLGTLPASAHALLREHARGCRTCDARYERLTAVQLRLEGGTEGLPLSRLALLEQQLLARTAQTQQAPTRRWWRNPGWFILGAAAAGGVLGLVLPAPVAQEVPAHDDLTGGYQARGAEDGAAFGVRAFCVASGAEVKVLGEAGPGEALSCPPGASIQLTYTAPREARLQVQAPGSHGGEALLFFPRQGEVEQLAAAVDAPLPHSTPVTAQWLTGPIELESRFQDPSTGELLGTSRLTLRP